MENKEQQEEVIMNDDYYEKMDEAVQYLDTLIFRGVVGEKFKIVNKKTLDMISKQDAAEAYNDHQIEYDVTINGEKKKMNSSVFPTWNKKSISYLGGIMFDPKEEPGTIIDKHLHMSWNTWNGWALSKVKNGKSKGFLSFIFTNICKRNKALYNYIMDAWANIIQNPGDKHDKIFVMRGDRGVGKTFMMERFMHILGEYGRILSQNDLESEFNKPFMNRLVVFADEACWSGDRKLQSKLQNISGGSTISIRKMRTDQIEMNNYIHIWMVSNNDWVAPVEKGNRRYVVWTVGDKRKVDTKYFTRLIKDMEDGGYEDLMYSLMNRDIKSNFRANAPVFDKETYKEQRLSTMTNGDPARKWLYYCENEPDMIEPLNNPCVRKGHIKTIDLYKMYVQWSNDTNEYKTLVQDIFNKQISKIVGPTHTKKIDGKVIRGRDFNQKLNIEL